MSLEEESQGSAFARSDTSRVEAFSDSVLGIILTLLIFGIKTPQVEPGELLAGLLLQWPGYVAYLASFVYLAVIWLNHQALFARVRSVDRGLKWANIGVLFTASLLPFPTAVLSTALQTDNIADQHTAIALYALVAGLMVASWMLIWYYLHNHPRLQEPHVDADFFRDGRLRAGAGVALYAVGVVLGYLLTPWIAVAVFLLLPPFYALTSEGLKDSPLRVRTRSERS